MYASIHLQDHLNHPAYHWPLSLLTEPVRFPQPVKPGFWQLVDGQGRPVPFQTTDHVVENGLVTALNLHFLSDLPTGGSRDFRFIPAESPPASFPADCPFSLTAEPEAGCFHIAYGTRRMTCRLNFEHIAWETLCAGSIFTEVEIRCCSGRKRHVLHLRLIRQLPFWELRETLEGFDGTEPPMELYFDGFDFNKRFSWKRPVEQLDDYLLDGKLPVTLCPYENWVPWCQSKFIAFSEEAVTAGLFVRSCLEWKEETFPLWGSRRSFGVSFYCKDGTLSACFPRRNGSRSMAIAVYPGNDLTAIQDMWLRCGWLDLNKVRQWVLDWEEPQQQYPLFFDPAQFVKDPPAPEDMDRLFYAQSVPVNDPLLCSPGSTTREFADWVPRIDVTAARMTPVQFAHVKAFFAFMAYATAEEDFFPTRNMLAGHPNFLVDALAAAGFAAALFPHHPHRMAFFRVFDDAIAKNLQYHLRPDVAAYNSLGGRHTESPGCYSRYHLRILMLNTVLLAKSGFHPAALSPQGAKWLNWFINILSAPVDGRRLFPEQGAHCYSPEIPYAVNLYAQLLEPYYPELAQNTYAVCQGSPLVNWILPLEHDPYRTLFTPKTGGTVSLQSEKFTGYGCILREAVGTPEEISLHVQQLDRGPNYRWGNFENTGNGGIFYYAAGKRYSMVSTEDGGDLAVGAEVGSCGFCVRKGHTFHNIGFRELTEPMYVFPQIKSIQLLADPHIAQYYKYRRASLVGKDYAVLYDAVTHMRASGRFTWSVHYAEEYPQIHQLLPGVGFTEVSAGNADILTSNGDNRTIPDQCLTKYRTYEGHGNFLTVVTHRKELSAEKTAFGAKVTLPGREDLLFESQARIRYAENGICFDGFSGIICQQGADLSGALLEGSKIGCGDFLAGLSGKGGFCFARDGRCWSGKLQAEETVSFTVCGQTVSAEKGSYSWCFDGALTLHRLPDRAYDRSADFIRDTRRHEFGFNGYDFWDEGELLHYPE